MLRFAAVILAAVSAMPHVTQATRAGTPISNKFKSDEARFSETVVAETAVPATALPETAVAGTAAEACSEPPDFHRPQHITDHDQAFGQDTITDIVIEFNKMISLGSRIQNQAFSEEKLIAAASLDNYSFQDELFIGHQDNRHQAASEKPEVTAATNLWWVIETWTPPVSESLGRRTATSLYIWTQQGTKVFVRTVYRKERRKRVEEEEVEELLCRQSSS